MESGDVLGSGTESVVNNGLTPERDISRVDLDCPSIEGSEDG
jgi:hypothetical protein